MVWVMGSVMRPIMRSVIVLVWSWASHEIILVVGHEVGQVVGHGIGHGVIPGRL